MGDEEQGQDRVSVWGMCAQGRLECGGEKGVGGIFMEYKPPKGFFDISSRPKTMSVQEHEKIQKLQLFLAEQDKHADYLRKHNPIQWEELKELSAELQIIIFQNWSLDEIS